MELKSLSKQGCGSMYVEEWRGFLKCRVAEALFPREMQTTRFIVNNEEEYLSFLRNNYDKMSCYTSLYSVPQLNKHSIDTIFLEVDGRNFNEIQTMAGKLEKSLNKLTLKYRKYFSGRRGFHYYIDFPSIELKYPRETIRAFLELLPKVYDPHVAGNLRQMVRVPYTIHPKTGLYAVKVEGKFSLSLALNPPRVLDFNLEINVDLPGLLAYLDERMEEKFKSMKISNIEVDLEYFPPCVIKCLSELAQTGELSHAGRLHMVSFLYRAGLTEDQILDIFRFHANDFRERYSRYQITHIIKGKMKCYSCRRAMFLGLCPLSTKERYRCPFFPNINFIW